MVALGFITVVLLEIAFLGLVRLQVFDRKRGHGGVPGLAYGAAAVAIAVLLLVMALLRTRRREVELGRVTEERARLEHLTEAVINSRNLDEMLETFAHRVRDVVRCEEVEVYVPSDTVDRLVLRGAAPGPGGGGDPRRPAGGLPARRPPAPEVVVGSGVVGTAASLGRSTASAPFGERWQMAWPMLLDGRVVGVVAASSTENPGLDAGEIALVDQAASRVARAVERVRLYEAELRSRLSAEHARSHVTIVAAVSELFDTALEEYEGALAHLADILVPAFADWCLIVATGTDGALAEIANHAVGEGPPERYDELTAAHHGWDGPIQSALRSGQADLRFGFGVEAEPDPFARLMRDLGIESSILLPIRVRGLSIGAIVLGRTPDRRGFRPSDQAAGEDVAGRVAVAVERVLLYRDNQEAAEAARRHADRIRRLMLAAPEITSPLSTEGVLQTLAEQARHVLGAKRAVVTAPLEGIRISFPPLEGDDGLGTEAIVAHVEHLLMASGPHDQTRTSPALPVNAETWLAVDITGSGLDVSVAIVLVGRDRAPFTEEDEAIVASMAQMAAAALANARLYQRVHENEDRLRAIVQAEPFAIVDLDLDCVVQTWNQAAEVMFQWPESMAEDGTGAADVRFPPEVDACLGDLGRRAARGEACVDIELSTQRPGGGRLELSMATAPLRGPDGEVTGMIAVISDITERKDLELRLQNAQRLEAIGKLAGGIAHDFNNLLTVILGYSDLLLRRTPDGDPARFDLEAIASAGQQAARVTSQLLAIGRHEVAEPAVVSVADVVGGLEDVLRRLITEDIVVDIDLEPGWLLIDPGQIERVLLNLVVNAGDAMPDGGRLIIRSRREVLEEPLATGHDVVPEGAWVVLSVADTGTGMTPDVLEHCFEPFFTTKEQGKGTGLGLATVYGLVDQHGGHIQIDTGPDGTDVRVFLPAVDEGVARRVEAAPQAGPVPRGSGHVLLVEDDPALRRFATEVLVTNGYTPLVATDPDGAIQLARFHTGPVDILVTDVVMPGMDGVELARRVHEDRPGLPVLYMSGYTGDAKEKLIKLREASNFLAKPFGPDELVARIRELLEGVAAADQGSNR